MMLCGHATAQQKPSPEFDLARLREHVRKKMTVANIPSVAVSVAQENKIIWEEGFGLADREMGISATPHTSFYLASVTKAITGIAVLVLQDQGKINLDYPVNEYLGEAKVHSPMWNPAEATVRRVATHNSGLTTYSRKCALEDVECKVSLDTAIRRYGILFWPPGDHFDYSNLGYGILGEVVSRVSKKSYPDFVRDEVFRPLGMMDCFLGAESERSKQIAAQYDSSSHVRTPAQVSDTPGASSAHCSVHDLVLLGMFALGEHPPNQTRILSDASLKKMLNPTVETGDGERYGFGWSLQPDHHGYVSVYAQGGTNDSFAVLQLIPSKKLAVAVIANTGTTVPFEIVDKVIGGLLPRHRDARASKKTARPEANTKTAASTSLAGTWAGALDTWKGSVPMTIELSPSRRVRVKWGGNQWIKASDTDIAAPRFYCVVHDQAGSSDIPQSHSDLELELYLYGETLAGAGTTKNGAQLPYWVQLQKSPGRQPAPSAH